MRTGKQWPDGRMAEQEEGGGNMEHPMLGPAPDGVLFWKAALFLEPGTFPGLEKELEARQIAPLRIPLTRTCPLEHNTLFWQAVCQIRQYDWALFLDEKAAEAFFAQLARRRMDVRELGHLKLAAGTEKAQRALEKRGLFPAFPAQADAAASVEKLLGLLCGRERILLPVGKEGQLAPMEALSAGQAAFDCVPLFQVVPSGAPLPPGWEDAAAVLESPAAYQYLGRCAGAGAFPAVTALSDEVERRAREDGRLVARPKRMSCRGIAEAVRGVLEQLEQERAQPAKQEESKCAGD